MAKHGKMTTLELGMLLMVGDYAPRPNGVWMKATAGMLVVAPSHGDPLNKLLVAPLAAFALAKLKPACVARVVRESRQILSLTVAGKTVLVWQAPDRELRAGHHMPKTWMEAAPPPAVAVPAVVHKGPWVEFIPPHKVGQIRAAGGEVTRASPFGGNGK